MLKSEHDENPVGNRSFCTMQRVSQPWTPLFGLWRDKNGPNPPQKAVLAVEKLIFPVGYAVFPTGIPTPPTGYRCFPTRSAALSSDARLFPEVCLMSR